MARPKVVNLFHTETFKPILRYGELERILNRLGFFAEALPSNSNPPQHSDDAVAWMVYSFNGKSSLGVVGRHAPHPRLPHPKIDMLHVDTYKVFIDTLGQYIGHEQVQNHIHIRGMPGPSNYNKDEMRTEVWSNEGLVPTEQTFAYRKGSIDEATKLQASILDKDCHDKANDK